MHFPFALLTSILSLATTGSCTLTEAPPPTYLDQYRRNASFVPDVVRTWRGPQIVAPDSPYVAALGSDRLYFIDTHWHRHAAAVFKMHMEQMAQLDADEVLYIDYEAMTAEKRRNLPGNKQVTTFRFLPLFVKMMFPKQINQCNLDANLYEGKTDHDLEVTYDVEAILKEREGFNEF